MSAFPQACLFFGVLISPFPANWEAFEAKAKEAGLEIVFIGSEPSDDDPIGLSISLVKTNPCGETLRLEHLPKEPELGLVAGLEIFLASIGLGSLPIGWHLSAKL